VDAATTTSSIPGDCAVDDSNFAAIANSTTQIGIVIRDSRIAD
jgi:hypothetical protein